MRVVGPALSVERVVAQRNDWDRRALQKAAQTDCAPIVVVCAFELPVAFELALAQPYDAFGHRASHRTSNSKLSRPSFICLLMSSIHPL